MKWPQHDKGELMARLFDDASTQYLTIDQAAVTDYPFAVSAWFYCDDQNLNGCLFFVGDKDAQNKFCFLRVNTSVLGAYAHYYDGAQLFDLYTSNSWTANQWHHGLGVWASSSDCRVYLDANTGNAGTDNTGPAVLTGHDRMRIGYLGDTTPRREFSGRIAEVAVWNLSTWPGATGTDKANAFVSAALAGLAAKKSALFYPTGLVGYWPLGGITANDADTDVVGGYNMSPVNTPSTADHVPGMIYPAVVRGHHLRQIMGAA
jgi:hypothetical protein